MLMVGEAFFALTKPCYYCCIFGHSCNVVFIFVIVAFIIVLIKLTFASNAAFIHSFNL